MNVNIESIREYNKQLREVQEKASKIAARIEINNAELDRLCTELSSELGTTINADNIEQVKNEYLQRIESILTAGEQILNRVKMEEYQATAGTGTAGMEVAATVAAAGGQGVAPAASSAVAPSSPGTFPQTPPVPGVPVAPGVTSSVTQQQPINQQGMAFVSPAQPQQPMQTAVPMGFNAVPQQPVQPQQPALDINNIPSLFSI